MKWTKTIQLWKGNILMTAQIKPEEAEKMIKEGIAKRINNQAIIYVDKNE